MPYDPPELVLSDKTYGLVSPEPYEWPDRAPLWTAAAYAAFDVALDPDSKEGKAKAVSMIHTLLKVHLHKEIVPNIVKRMSEIY